MPELISNLLRLESSALTADYCCDLAVQVYQHLSMLEESCSSLLNSKGGSCRTASSIPSDVGHLLLLADIHIEVVVALVDAHNLVLIHLVTCPHKQLASLLHAFQGICCHLPLFMGC